ncbi:type II toxin-antitoxin system RelE/ParE family toxin [Acinetobacter qingfengensis]|uniref:Addiction module toxin RelE n=1 Tax=Acinetobacter qingfengensis TaxID=1262585 RepID=A0A1E7RAC6_9GAMM|nr:type II toxin-antitoxin system RelE/ParE family toxin [Acinetobacter qingfengensis]KAA8733896.1 type II toxin-antitoxin system RelE/ParE family toxin [Acinetobacter qingfengensis]OEY96183.1 addiction module toxin RelE [Acinetobacter qingfengensis]
MTSNTKYSLEFDPRALKEWKKLGSTIQTQFKKKLAKILENPHIEANRLSGFSDCYKIKLKASGYRLVYQVQDDVVLVFVLAVGKRERSEAYELAHHRVDE